MISRDLFNRMSFIALVMIVLFGAISFRSMAYEYNPSEEESFIEVYEPSSILYYDSGIESAFTKDDAASIRKDIASIKNDIEIVRQNSDIFIYFVVPVSFAFLIAAKFILWIFRTFIQGSLG